jgi:hypothetical protein
MKWKNKIKWIKMMTVKKTRNRIKKETQHDEREQEMSMMMTKDVYN